MRHSHRSLIFYGVSSHAFSLWLLTCTFFWLVFHSFIALSGSLGSICGGSDDSDSVLNLGIVIREVSEQVLRVWSESDQLVVFSVNVLDLFNREERSVHDDEVASWLESLVLHLVHNLSVALLLVVATFSGALLGKSVE